MSQSRNAPWGLVMVFWCMTAYAQHVSKPSFGDQFKDITPATWFFVALFTFIGVIWRFIDFYRTGGSPRWIEYFAILFLGAIAGYVGFELCNAWRFRMGWPMTDGIQGGVIIVFAHNYERWLTWFTTRIEAGADAGAQAWQAFKTGGK